jgi:hypothetical protein
VVQAENRVPKLNTFGKFATDPGKISAPNLCVTAFRRREIVLAYANAFGKLLLRHNKAAHLSDAATPS